MAESHSVMLMSEPVKLHRKQFIVGPQPWRIEDSWQIQTLGENLHLSYCPELRTTSIEDSDGHPWVLLGLATQSVADRPDPIDEIRGFSQSTDIQSMYNNWTGRWLLIGDRRIHPDAAAMLSVFHGRDAQGRTWASSSPALLAQCIELDSPSLNQPHPLTYERGITWHPLPMTHVDGVSHLLPSAVLNVVTGIVEPRRLLPDLPFDEDPESLTTAFGDALVESCRRLKTFNEPILVSMSGGSDSRLILSAAVAADIEFKTFTRLSSRMSVADCIMPPQLAEAVDREHYYIRPPGREPKRADLVRLHTADHVPVGEAKPLIECHRDSIRGITLGGQNLGVGKLVFRIGTKREYESDDDKIASIFDIHGVKASQLKSASLRAWITWTNQHPVKGMDWRDRFFIEQRMAGWQAMKEQLYDMQPHERFIPVNCARTYAIVLSIPEPLRMNYQHHQAVIRRLTPAIADWPFNPPDYHFGILRSTCLRLTKLHSWREPVFFLRTNARTISRRWKYGRS